MRLPLMIFSPSRRSSFASWESTSGSGSDGRRESVSSDEMDEIKEEPVKKAKVISFVKFFSNIFSQNLQEGFKMITVRLQNLILSHSMSVIHVNIFRWWRRWAKVVTSLRGILYFAIFDLYFAISTLYFAWPRSMALVSRLKVNFEKARRAITHLLFDKKTQHFKY